MGLRRGLASGGQRTGLPAPLKQAANRPLALQVQALLPADAGDIVVKRGDLISVRGRYSDAQPFRGLLAFGGDAAGAKVRDIFGKKPKYADMAGLCRAASLKEIEAQGWASNP